MPILSFDQNRIRCGLRTACLSGGFTLIELLLSLAMFVLVAGSLFSVFSSGVQVSRRSEGIGGAYQEARLLADVLSRDLENIVAFSMSPESSDSFFQGGPGGMLFVVAAPDGLKTVRYGFSAASRDRVHTILLGRRETKNRSFDVLQQEDADQTFLVREEVGLSPYSEGNSDDQAQVEILSSVLRQSDVVFSFGYREPSSGTLAWSSSWDRSGLPVGVRLDMRLRVSDDQQDIVPLRRDIIIPLGVWGPA